MASLNAELTPKRLELLHELIPAAKSIAALVNPTSPTAENITRNLHAAAMGLGLQLHVRHAATEGEIDTACASLAMLQVEGSATTADPFFDTRRVQFVALSSRYAMPTISLQPCHHRGRWPDELWRQLQNGTVYSVSTPGGYSKASKPADLPVQQVPNLLLAINLKQEKDLGLDIRPSRPDRVDEVFE